MKKKIVPIISLIIGICFVGLSIYIKEQIAEGNQQIEGAQSKVDKANSLFSIAPQTKTIGKRLTGSAQNKINAGKEEVMEYQQYSNWLMIGGIGLIAFGGWGLFRSKRVFHK